MQVFTIGTLDPHKETQSTQYPPSHHLPIMQVIIDTAGKRSPSAALQLEDIPAFAGGGPASSRILQHFVFHAPPRRQFLMPAYPPGIESDADKQVCLIRGAQGV